MRLGKDDLRYLAVPVVGTGTSFGVRTLIGNVFYAGAEIGWLDGFLVGFVGWACAVFACYAVSRKFVFRSKAPVLPEMAAFVGGRFGTMFLESGIVMLAARTLQDASLASLCGSLGTSVVNWILARRLMMKKEADSGGGEMD